LLYGVIDLILDEPGFSRQSEHSKATRETPTVGAHQRIGRTTAARLFHEPQPAINGHRLVDVKSIRGIDRQPFEDASFEPRVTERPCRTKLPLGSFGVGAILKRADGATVFQGPDKKLGRIHCQMRNAE
jgi:hypothetical protein